jgi:ABC-type glycerol-3-phosphate transport system permease component
MWRATRFGPALLNRVRSGRFHPRIGGRLHGHPDRLAVWMMRGYFNSIPVDLEESAWLEGASRTRSLWSIFLQFSVPANAVTAIFTFISAWNESAGALTLLHNQNNAVRMAQEYLIGGLDAGAFT